MSREAESVLADILDEKSEPPQCEVCLSEADFFLYEPGSSQVRVLGARESVRGGGGRAGGG